jgi:hypothetical protein
MTVRHGVEMDLCMTGRCRKTGRNGYGIENRPLRAEHVGTDILLTSRVYQKHNA